MLIESTSELDKDTVQESGNNSGSNIDFYNESPEPIEFFRLKESSTVKKPTVVKTFKSETVANPMTFVTRTKTVTMKAFKSED